MAMDWTYGSASLWGPDRSQQFNTVRNAAADQAVYQQQRAEYEADDTERLRRAQMERDREYELRAQQVKQQAASIAVQKGQAEANAWYNRQMVQLSKDKLAEESRQFDVTASGYLNGAPTLAREQFQNDSLLDWGKFASSLKGPADWVAYKRMTSGVANNIGSIPGLSWTAGGQQGNTTFSGTPQVLSVQKLLGDMGAGGNWAQAAAGQASSGGLSLNPSEQQIYQTADEFARNPQGSAPGWFEGLDPATREMIKGAAEAQGHDWATTMARFNRSRWGGGGSSVAA